MRIGNLIGACLGVAILSACGSAVPMRNAGTTAQPATVDESIAKPARHVAKNGSLYVANVGANTVTVYAAGSDSVARTISDGVVAPDALAFDGSGNLYVANAGANTVTVYAPGSSSALRTISQGVNDPRALALDGSGNLYVANGGASTVTVYGPSSNVVLRTISRGVNVPDALAAGKAGNLDVGNVYGAGYSGGTVTVYKPGGVAPKLTLPQGSAPVALLYDSSGNLYVANDSPPCCYENWVTVYSPQKKLLRTINLVHHPDALAFDASGNLYVADNGGKYEHPVGQITVFAPGSNAVLRTLSIAVHHPVALLVDGSGNLFVANNSANTVTVYADGQTLQRTISDGISAPAALAFGP